MKQEYIKLSEFFNREISPFLLGAFFSRYIFINEGKYIVTPVNYKRSQKVEIQNFDFEEYFNSYRKVLNKNSGYYQNWLLRESIDKNIQLPRGQIFYILENDLEISEESFFNKLYAKIISTCDWLYDYGLTKEKKSFIRGYMELRGSIDTTIDYISQDYFYNSQFEIKKARMLIDYMNVPYTVVNLNFRQLQKQYYTNVNKRNTQLRLELFWYMHNIGILNEYKAKIFMISREVTNMTKVDDVYYFYDYKKEYRPLNAVEERLSYYSTNIFEKEIAESDIAKMRSNLGFDGPLKSIRNNALIESFKYLSPDECMGCKNYYKIEDRTFINKRTGRPYLEVHHMISLGLNKDLDDENNLVKLCSSCHNNLKKGSATAESQKELIKEIYKNSPNVLEFAKHFFDNKNFEDIIELTFLNLK